MPASPFQLYRQAYHGLSRNSWLLSLVMLINRSGTMVIPFIALYCTQKLHFTVEQAGYIMGIFGLGSILGAYLGGKLTDRYGFYDIQLFALFAGGIMFILLGLQRSFWPLAILSFVLSLCNDAFRPANSAAIAHHSSPETKTRSYSLNRLAVNLGWAFGGAIGGILASINYSWLFWVDGCTNIFAALVLLKLIPRSDYRNTHVKAPATEIVNSAYKDKAYLVFIILVTMFAACFFQMFGLQSVFYKTKWHFNEDYIGMLMALNGLLIAVIEMVVVHRLEGRRHPLVYITIGVLLTGVSFSVMSVLPASPFSGLVVVFFITIGEMVSMPFMNTFWVSRTNNYNRGQYAALYSMSWAAAQLLAPTLGTQVVEQAGFNMLWWATGGVCAVAALGFWLLFKLKFKSKNSKNLVEATYHSI